MTLKRIFAELGLGLFFRRHLILRGIRTIADLKKAIADGSAIIDIIIKKLKSKEKIELLEAYLRVDEISQNFELNKELIENNFPSYYDITHIPLFEFQNRFSNISSEEELKRIYYRAKEELESNITMDSLSTLLPSDYDKKIEEKD